MFYYKILDLNNNILGYVTSYNLGYYSQSANMLLSCTEEFAQYVSFNQQIYRVPWLHREHISMKGKYPEIQMDISSHEEYMEWLEKQNSEQK